MTLTTYRALERDAMQRYERLRAICPAGTEIVYVISQSVRDMMLNVASAGITTHFHRGEGILGVYRGTRIFMEGESFPQDAFGQDFFEPAVVTDRYIQGMEIGDLIIGPNNRIYFLAQVIRNTDGTVTSRFEELEIMVDVEAINCAAMEEAMERIGEMGRNLEYTMAFSAAPASSMNVTCRPQKEENLILGDTSTLDEFLNSFARTGFLQAAT